MIRKEDLKKLWWYRTLNVLFLLLLTLQTVAVFIISLDKVPTVDPDSTVYSMKCDDFDKTFRVNNAKIQNNDGIVSFKFKDEDDIKGIRFFCTNPELHPSLRKEFYESALKHGTIPDTDNFRIFVEEYHYKGSWMQTSVWLFCGLLIILGTAFLIKAIFMYIVIGEPPIKFAKKLR